MTEVSDGSPEAELPVTSKQASELSVGDVIVADVGQQLRVDDVSSFKAGKHGSVKVLVRTTDTVTGMQRQSSYVAGEKVRVVAS
ncbi:hypothetical protein OG203_00530 [Nocardia sp. NBC_01499]|uniref:hypothetical protein n=1 Tax=Nocardia sp. NBC_01499 TaxID=2903597 RepID=UPI0038663F91